MFAFYEDRVIDSPYVDRIWHAQVEQDVHPVCPADARWNLVFVKYNGTLRVSIEGGTSQCLKRSLLAGSEYLVIEFKLGVYMPDFPAGKFLNKDVVLPEAAARSLWLNDLTHKFPDFEDAGRLTDKLVQQGLLVRDPVIEEALQGSPPPVSQRALQYHFLRATGLPLNRIRQIERAHHALALLQQGTSILDTVHDAGYFDQPHLTRSLKRYTGQTPAQIARSHAASADPAG